MVRNYSVDSLSPKLISLLSWEVSVARGIVCRLRNLNVNVDGYFL